MVELYLTAAAVVSCGAIWFYIVRPMLEDWGVLAPRDVSDNAPPAPVVMSRSAPTPPQPIVSEGVATRDQTDQTAPVLPLLRPATLDTCKVLRAHGFSRDAARMLLRPLGWTLDNNTWTQAAPLKPADDDLTVTPFAGRVTRRSFYQDDPELEYQPPA
jgi:hypothetical protein